MRHGFVFKPPACYSNTPEHEQDINSEGEEENQANSSSKGQTVNLSSENTFCVCQGKLSEIR